MSDPVVVTATGTTVVVAQTTATEVIVTGVQGPPGPPGPLAIPDPSDLADGRMLAVLDGAYIDIPPPAGTGDMQTLIYDPRGVSADAFDLSNLTGVLDGGVFT